MSACRGCLEISCADCAEALRIQTDSLAAGDAALGLEPHSRDCYLQAIDDEYLYDASDCTCEDGARNAERLAARVAGSPSGERGSEGAQ